MTTLLNEPPDPNRPTVAFDMEGTLSAGVTWQGLRDYLLADGREAEFKAFYRPRMLKMPLYALGLVNKQRFREDWIRGIFRLFAGQSREQFEEVSAWVVEHELWPKRRRSVLAELQGHLDAGRRVVVISGLIEPMLRLFVNRIGCEAIGTPLDYDQNGRFTGETKGPFITGPQKVAQLAPFKGPEGKIEAAYGDTGADIPMLAMSRLPTAVAPDRRLRRVATANGWRILEAGS